MSAPGFREAALERAAIAGERETNRFRFGRARPPRSAAWCSGRPAPRRWLSARIPTRR